MSLYNYWAAPEPEYSDDEWERAYAQLIDERLDLEWTREDAEAHIDDWMVADKCEQMREDRESIFADEERARRKENW